MHFEYYFLLTFVNVIYCYQKINPISYKLGPANRSTVKSVSDDAVKELVKETKQICNNFFIFIL